MIYWREKNSLESTPSPKDNELAVPLNQGNPNQVTIFLHLTMKSFQDHLSDSRPVQSILQ